MAGAPGIADRQGHAREPCSRKEADPRDELAAFVAELDGAEAGLTLAEWAAAAQQALVASGGPTRGSAADLVLADRRRRSEEPARL